MIGSASWAEKAESWQEMLDVDEEGKGTVDGLLEGEEGEGEGREGKCGCQIVWRERVAVVEVPVPESRSLYHSRLCPSPPAQQLQPTSDQGFHPQPSSTPRQNQSRQRQREVEAVTSQLSRVV